MPTRTRSTRLTLLIIEFNYHAEVLQAICPMLEERFDLILFTTDKIWRKTGLDESMFTAVRTRGKNAPLKRFFRENGNLVSRADIAYFNTLEKHHRFFSANPLAIPTIVRIHNTNSNLLPLSSIDFKGFSITGIAWHLLRRMIIERDYWHRKALFDTVTGIMLPSEAAREYLRERHVHRYRGKITPYSLPFCHLEAQIPPPRKNSGSVKIAITGSINPKRKDFHQLYDAVVDSLDRLNKPMELIFMGSPKGTAGENVLKKFGGISHEKFSFSYAEKYIPAREMKQRMEDVHFVIAPVLVETHHKIYREIYGSSKISGVENDIVQFQRPALITGKYRLSRSIAPVCEPYRDTGDLGEKLISWVNDEEYSKLQDKFSTLDAYRTENILDQFESLCRNLIDNFNHPQIDGGEQPGEL